MPKSLSELLAFYIDTRHKIKQITVARYQVIRLHGNCKVEIGLIVHVPRKANDRRNAFDKCRAYDNFLYKIANLFKV